MLKYGIICGVRFNGIRSCGAVATTTGWLLCIIIWKINEIYVKTKDWILDLVKDPIVELFELMEDSSIWCSNWNYPELDQVFGGFIRKTKGGEVIAKKFTQLVYLKAYFPYIYHFQIGFGSLEKHTFKEFSKFRHYRIALLILKVNLNCWRFSVFN